ncbi:hypothetical protein [Streptomyces sp. NPDC059278]|uniref:hypothetical protein n=1 Tax=Streptomyces sp. NPDC059278 TaxID=3346801 RepID=UPI0036BD1A97
MALLTSALLAKVATPWAGKLALSGFTKVIRRPKVARAAAKRATESGIQVTAKSLRIWLARKDTGEQLRTCSEASLDQAAGRLAYMTPGGSAEERRRNALQVLRIVMEESVRAADPSQATLLIGSWGLQTTKEEGQKTRDQLRELQQDVRGRGGLEQAVRTLSPWAAKEALPLTASWPGVIKCMDILTTVGRQRGDVLRQWADAHPAWLEDAPAGAHAWLGHLAADYDAPGAARHFFEMCLREGGHPRDYYTMLAALAEEDGTDEGARHYLDTHGAGGSSSVLVAFRAFLDGAWEQGLVDLRQWEPHDARAAAIKTHFEAKALLNLQRSEEALVVLREAAESSTSIGITLAATLLEQARNSRTTNRLGAGQEALALALRARNSRRSWSGDSIEAAVLAVQAAVVSEDLALAWKLARPAPEGEAEPHEAEDPRMGMQTALVAAMTGRWREAEELVQRMPHGFARAHAAAVLTDSKEGRGANTADVQRLWQEAWEVAGTEGEQFTAATGLASSGADLPDLSHLKPLYGERVQELELLARALHAEGSDPLSLLRANVTRSPAIVVTLAERYHRAGDIVLAAETLRDGSAEWNDARLMAMAAGLFLEAKDHRRASP